MTEAVTNEVTNFFDELEEMSKPEPTVEPITDFDAMERTVLKSAIFIPEEYIEEFAGIIPTKKDQRKIEKAIHEDAKREEEHRKELDAIARSYAPLWVHPRNR
jgi:hypothetical protein